MKTKIARGPIGANKTSLTSHVAIARGLAEFRGGRPVVFCAKHPIIAMPIDGCDASSLNSFLDSPGGRRRVSALPANVLARSE